MTLILLEINETNLADVAQVDSVFTVEAVLHLNAQDENISYSVASVPPYEKRYPIEDLDYADYLHQPDKVIFLAYIDGQIAGRIVLKKNWNHYGYIDDIAVNRPYRRLGVGRGLINEAIRWAKDKGLPGLMLETQNNNVDACRFYERCGFRLRGFDTYLYRALDPKTEEVALYWYLSFEEEKT